MVDISKISSLANFSNSSGVKAQSGKSATEDTSSKGSKADELKTQFLSILLTQMQHQNPLDPMDTKEFTGQLAQFSALEQQIDTNSKLDKLVEAMSSNASTAAFGYIGQDADLNSNMTIVEDGAADWKYAINAQAKDLTIKVKDEAGKVIYEKKLTNVDSGVYSLNAKEADFTDEVEDGQILKLEISGTDMTGQAIRTDIMTTVKVDGVETSAEGINLRAGGLTFGLSDVLRFKTPAPSPTGTTPAETAETESDDTTEPAADAA